MERKASAFREGLGDGVPIALGYFTVSLSLGVVMGNLGLSAAAGGLMSLTNMTSAGQFAGVKLIAAGAGLLLMALLQLLINARYLLMSCALSQRLDASVPTPMRLLLGITVTDEIFGISIRRPERYLDPRYSLGAFCVACPGWTLGTVCGVVLGNLLPGRVVSALGVALFAMLMAVFLPAAKQDRVVAAAVGITMLLNWLMTRLPLLQAVPEGLRILLLTILIAGAAALAFPREEGEDDA